MNGRLLGLTMLAVGLLGYGADPTSSSAASGGSALATTTAAVPQHGRMGDRGTSVEAIQTTLAGYGYTVAIDGVFGPQTERAVKAWQRSNGLEVDGIAGPITLASLGVGEVSVPAERGEQVPTVAVDTPPVPHYDQWVALAVCESGSRWDYNGSSGYDGGLQFLPSTWTAMGGGEFAPYAWQASALEQMIVAERTLDASGWGAWPACSRRLGLR